jgi:3-deoxy-D-manno-octulosonic-acid transferase
MKIAILEASSSILHIIEVPEHLKQCEEIENYLIEEGFQLSNIDWMEVKGIITDIIID